MEVNKKNTSDNLAEEVRTDGTEKKNKKRLQELLYLANGYPSIKTCLILSHQMSDTRLRSTSETWRMEQFASENSDSERNLGVRVEL